jgi:hypothetical protein
MAAFGKAPSVASRADADPRHNSSQTVEISHVMRDMF